MTIFSARDPRDHPIDPAPFVRPSDGARGGWELEANFLPGQSGPFGILEQLHYDPRPEYSCEQVNQSNPFLVAYRDDAARLPPHRQEWLQFEWLRALNSVDGPFDNVNGAATKVIAVYDTILTRSTEGYGWVGTRTEWELLGEYRTHALAVLTRMRTFAALSENQLAYA